jgi:hypothetical protein
MVSSGICGLGSFSRGLRSHHSVFANTDPSKLGMNQNEAIKKIEHRVEVTLIHYSPPHSH